MILETPWGAALGTLFVHNGRVLLGGQPKPSQLKCLSQGADPNDPIPRILASAVSGRSQPDIKRHVRNWNGMEALHVNVEKVILIRSLTHTQ